MLGDWISEVCCVWFNCNSIKHPEKTKVKQLQLLYPICLSKYYCLDISAVQPDDDLRIQDKCVMLTHAYDDKRVPSLHSCLICGQWPVSHSSDNGNLSASGSIQILAYLLMPISASAPTISIFCIITSSQYKKLLYIIILHNPLNVRYRIMSAPSSTHHKKLIPKLIQHTVSNSLSKIKSFNANTHLKQCNVLLYFLSYFVLPASIISLLLTQSNG